MGKATTHDIEAISEDVTLIPLPLPLDGLDRVNAYAIRGTDGITLVDPGWFGEHTDRALVRGLAAIDAEVGDVRRILVTHGHWDHYSAALGLRRHHRLEIWLGDGERPTLDSLAGFAKDPVLYPRQIELLERSGANELAERVRSSTLRPHERDLPLGYPDHWLIGGESIDLGGTRAIAHATPGHTRGHISYELSAEGLVFTGDHVLPRITPSVGFERMPVDRPLASYLASLRLLCGRPELTMLPAHGAVAPSVRERAEELLDHHDKRLDEIASLIESRGATAFAIADSMRWTRRSRRLDELSAIQAMIAVMEVRVHLEHLVELGRLRKDDSGPIETYAV